MNDGNDGQQNDGTEDDADHAKRVARVAADELGLVEHMSFHRATEIRLARDSCVAKERVEREDLKDVPMFAVWRTRRDIAAVAVLGQSSGAEALCACRR